MNSGEKGGEHMATALTRLTFAVTKEMEPRLADAKKNLFNDRTQADMIRELVSAGLNVLDEKKSTEQQNA